jgi:hypothetical protein
VLSKLKHVPSVFRKEAVCVSESWPDWTLVQEASSPSVYVIHGGAKYGVPSPRALEAGGWAEVLEVPDGALEEVPEAPDGTVLHQRESGRVFRVYRGVRLHVQDPIAEKMYELPGIDLPDEMVEAIPYAGRYRGPVESLPARAWLRVRRFRHRHGRLLDQWLWLLIAALIGAGISQALEALLR